ncbi:MAG: hypothetical protein RLZZ546_2981 [Bacteroidota bacterium]|jgi:hypothetical protein
MKKKYLVWIAIWISIAISTTSVAQEKINVPLSHPNKPGKLEMSLVFGSIHVTGYNGMEVIIDSKNKSNKTKQVKVKKGMKKIGGGDGLSITVEERNNIVEIFSEFPQNDVDFIITVPYNFSLELSTVNGGDIIVDHVIGSHEITNVNGGIIMTKIGGSVVANTLNEDIEVSFDSVTPNGPMAFTNLNGDIEVAFPVNSKFNFVATTDNGDIFSDFDVNIIGKTDKGSKGIKQNGYYKINKSGGVEAKVNGGGIEYSFTTMNGDITIKKTQ